MPIRTPVFESIVLADNPMRDSAARTVLVYLPPDYDEDPARRYPVVYFLPGFASRGSMLLNESLWEETVPQRLDRLILNAEIRPLILVSPDASTRLGGSQYINSSATGRYADYVADELVGWVDANYRTIPARDQRAVMGKSSGGYGALRFGMKRSDVFAVVAAHSADMGFDLCYRPDFPKCVAALAPFRHSVEEFLRGFPQPRQDRGAHWFDLTNILAMASCYSPAPASACGFELPFDSFTCELHADVWEHWLAHDPLRAKDVDIDALRSLRLLHIDCGRRDEHHLHLGGRAFSRRLKEKHVPHTYEEFDGGHYNTAHRYDLAFRAISQQFSKG